MRLSLVGVLLGGACGAAGGVAAEALHVDREPKIIVIEKSVPCKCQKRSWGPLPTQDPFKPRVK